VRIKLDENLHRDVAGVLTAAGHDVDTAADEGLVGSHAGILVLRLDDQSLPATRAAGEDLVQDVALDDLSGCVAVYRHGNLRVRRPGGDRR